MKNAVWHNHEISMSVNRFQHYIFLVLFLCMPYTFQKLFSATIYDKFIQIYMLFGSYRFFDIYWYSHLHIDENWYTCMRKKNLFNIISTASIQGMKYNIYIILPTLFFVIFGCFIQRSLFFVMIFGCSRQQYIKW